jgi:protein O-mannosyl-transferase
MSHPRPRSRRRAASEPPSPAGRPGEWLLRPGWRADAAVAALLIAASALVFASSTGGDFVYDDTRQILSNPLVRGREPVWKALTSDVWAFKSPAQGGPQQAMSDFWRPVFVLGLIAQERLFGVDDPVPWHWTLVLLHGAVAAAAYGLLCRMRMQRALAAAVALIFAVHPAHAESVAWISGGTDPLMSLPLLGALACVVELLERPALGWWAAALGLYATALLVKEAAIVFPGVVFLTAAVAVERPGEARLARLGRAVRLTLPFAALAGLYFWARLEVLGRFEYEKPWSRGLGQVLLTAPSLVWFYLREALVPVWTGPCHPLRPVRPADVDLASFWLPAAGVALVALWLGRAAWRGRIERLGLGLFALFLAAPVLKSDALPPDQIVHDRYLYLPLLGVGMVVLPALAAAARRLWGWDETRAAGACLRGALGLSVLLGLQTVRTGGAWRSEQDLWTAAARSDPGSAFVQLQNGKALGNAGRLAEARAALVRVVAMRPSEADLRQAVFVRDGLLERASVSVQEGRFAEAEADLKRVLEARPEEEPALMRDLLAGQQQQAVERLAMSLGQQGRREEAIEAMRAGRERLPGSYCSLSSNLAVLLVQAGRKGEALAELERARGHLSGETSPLCQMVLFYLGQLYAESGRAAEARAALEEYLATSGRFLDGRTQALRAQAEQMLGRLGAK